MNELKDKTLGELLTHEEKIIRILAEGLIRELELSECKKKLEAQSTEIRAE